MIIKHNSIILSVNTKFAFNRFFGKYSVYLEKNNKKKLGQQKKPDLLTCLWKVGYNKSDRILMV